MQPVDADAFLAALLAAPRPGAERILAFYDHRAGRLCTDGRLLLLPLDDHICHRGDGLFESLCFRQRRVFALDAHMARLREGASALSLAPPCPWEDIRARVLDVCRASGADHGDVRVFLSRGPGGFGVSPAECPQAGLYVVALRAPLPDAALYARGVTAFSSAVPPKQQYLARIKSVNYLPNVLMAMEAGQKGMDVAVSFDERGRMGEAAVANVALVDAGGRLLCPEPERILPGTTMLAAMELAARFMPVAREGIPRAAIATARELLLFTSATLCLGVTHFDGRPVGRGDSAGRPGPVAQRLRRELEARMLATGTPF